MPTYEYTVMLFDENEWRPVGTTGNFAHVRNEFRDWKRGCPEAHENGHLKVAYRQVNPWKIIGAAH